MLYFSTEDNADITSWLDSKKKKKKAYFKP